MKKQIAILGSTGSIGTQALQVIEEQSDQYEAYVLTANNRVEELIAQARKFKPEAVVIANETKYAQLKEALADRDIDMKFKVSRTTREIQGVKFEYDGFSFSGSKVSREFTIEELSKHGIGYVATEGPFFGYLIIPYYYKGTLRYYNARNVIGQGPRYNNPNKDITGLGKEFIIFNQDALDMYSSIFICEGAINALTMGDRAIATMGKAISAYQVNQLIKSPVNRFILLLDPDAIKYSINLAFKLVAYKKVKVIQLPEGKDCNDLQRPAVMKLVYQTRYQSYSDLVKLKNSL